MGIANFKEVRNGLVLAFFTALFDMSGRSMEVIRKSCGIALIRQSVLPALFACIYLLIAQSAQCGEAYHTTYLSEKVIKGEISMTENSNETEQGKNVPFSSSMRNILPLLISGYRFDNDQNNFMLNVCCGIPFEDICFVKMMMEAFAPKQDCNADVKNAGNDIFLPPLPVITNNFAEDKNAPLLFDSIFFKGQNNLMYSKRKAGKTKLAMEVAKSPLIRRPAFILREDYNDCQADDFRCIVGDKAIIVTMQDWHNTREEIEAKKSSANFREILLQCVNPEYRKIQNISKSVWAQAGKLKKSSKSPDIAIFHAVVEKLINQGVDFICLDSLNALLGGTTNFGRDTIESILEPMSGTGVTFLLIHHENKNGKMFGSENLPASFDHIYHLELQRKEGREILTLDEESRNTAPNNLTILRTWENGVPIYEVLPESAMPSEPTSLPDRIMEVLSLFDEETVLFDDLFDQLEQLDIKTGTLKNKLKELENKGLIEKADGKTWSSIKLKQK